MILSSIPLWVDGLIPKDVRRYKKWYLKWKKTPTQIGKDGWTHLTENV